MSVLRLTPQECAHIVIAVSEMIKPNFGNLTRVRPLNEIMETEVDGSSVDLNDDLAKLAASTSEKWERTVRCLPLVLLSHKEESGAGIFQRLYLTYSGKLLIWKCLFIVHSDGRTSSAQSGNEFALGTEEALALILTPERTEALLSSLGGRLAESVRRAETRAKDIRALGEDISRINRRLDV